MRRISGGRAGRRVGAAVVAVGAAVALAAAGCSSSAPTPAHSAAASPDATRGASTSAHPSPTPDLSAYYQQKLAWSACDDGFQCATLTVPLDYAHPTGAVVKLPLVRLPAADPAQRIGSLVINPGGPGASGVQYALAAKSQFTPTVRARFDIVGFDPRGVGGSVPSLSCLSDAQLTEFFNTPPVPASAAEVAQIVAEDKALAAGCEAHDAALLRHISTLDEARDMDVLRAALGDAKLTYLGKSYGTFLGAKYAQLFPTHIRAMVLDGALDPSIGTMQQDLVQAEGFESQLHAFFSWCATQSGGCPLGTSVSGEDARLVSLEQSVRSHPLTYGGRVLGEGLFFDGLAGSLYDPTYGWPDLRVALYDVQNGDAQVMLELSDFLTGRQPNGSYSNLQEANAAINCVDRPSPTSLSTYSADAAAFARQAPDFGAAIAWGSSVCAYWPVPPVEAAAPVRAAGSPPILVVGNTGDPATPYVWAQALARQLAHGVLLTWTGNGHTAYEMGSTCVDDAVDAYLVSLTTSPGLVCH